MDWTPNGHESLELPALEPKDLFEKLEFDKVIKEMKAVKPKKKKRGA